MWLVIERDKEIVLVRKVWGGCRAGGVWAEPVFSVEKGLEQGMVFPGWRDYWKG